MTCKEIQDKLLTDHIDGRMSSAQIAILDAHLCSCAACRKFSLAVRDMEDVFHNDPRQEPAPMVWEAVRDRIEMPPDGLLEGWRRFISGAWMRPVVTLATMAIVVLCVTTLVPGISPVSAPSSPSILMMAYLSEEESASLVMEEDDMTVIEYFFNASGTISG